MEIVKMLLNNVIAVHEIYLTPAEMATKFLSVEIFQWK